MNTDAFYANSSEETFQNFVIFPVVELCFALLEDIFPISVFISLGQFVKGPFAPLTPLSPYFK